MSKLITLNKRLDFQRIHTKGVKWVTPSFVVYAGRVTGNPPERLHTREPVYYAVVASKKVGNAVRRNRCKRRLRAVVNPALLEGGCPLIGYLFYARDALLTYEAQKLKEDVQWALRHLHRLLNTDNPENPDAAGSGT